VGKQNILMIVSDQLAPQLTGAYGHPVVQTPNLDALAARGVRFDNAYTPCPICSPARVGLMTGNLPSRHDCYDNTSVLASDAPTVSHYLAMAGYETVLSGKMHFVGPDQLHGFEHRLTTDIFPSDFQWLPQRTPGQELPVHGHHQDAAIAIDYVTAGVRQWNMGLDHDEEVQAKALEYIRHKRSDYTDSLQRPLPERDERPFFLCVSYHHPHEPFHVTRELWDLYEAAEIALPEYPDDMEPHSYAMDRMLNHFHGTGGVDLDDPAKQYDLRRAYYGLVTYIDRKVGELLAELDNCGLTGDTLVVFMSDHGDMLGERRMIQKRTFYEWSSRVPLIFAGGGWEEGLEVREPVSLVDIMPTVLELAGVAEQPVQVRDGKSLVGLLEGVAEPERAVFSELHAEGVHTTCVMARQGDLKYVHTTGFAPQLYDLAKDPDEWQNLAGLDSYAEDERRLAGLVAAEFDFDAIERDVTASLDRRRIVKQAKDATGGPQWDFQPRRDATEQYWRKS
jgi:choline-sulfatase